MGQFAANTHGYHITCAPGGLEVESSGYGVYVQDLPGKEQSWDCLAFQGSWVYGVQANPAAGDEFLLETGAAVYGVEVAGENLFQAGTLVFADFSPSAVPVYACAFEDVLP